MKLDDDILHNAMQRFGLTKEQVKKALQEMIDEGLLQKNDNPTMPAEFKLTTNGNKFAEKSIIEKFGEFKKVVNHKGVAYRVPTIIIMREGINEEDLHQFPLWSDDG